MNTLQYYDTLCYSNDVSRCYSFYTVANRQMCANPKAEWVKKLLEQLRYDMLTHFKMSIRGCLDAHLKICKSIKRFVFGISHVRTTYFLAQN